VADLIAIGFDDESTAASAGDRAREHAEELRIAPDAVAVIVRDGDGTYEVRTNHHAIGTRGSWGMVWEALFGSLFFVPVLGMDVGDGLGSVIRKVERLGIDHTFREEARALLQPGCSAVFVLSEDGDPDQVIEALTGLGGTAVRSSLRAEAGAELQHHLHGGSPLT